MADQVDNSKCPRCTGPLKFNATKGKLICEYCDYEVDPEEVATKTAEKQEQLTQNFQEAESKNANVAYVDENLKSYNCPSCGADLICEQNTAATNCPYCGNPAIVPGQYSGDFKPDVIIPFKIEKEQAIEKLRSHYSGKILLPKAFTEGNKVEKIQGVYVPFYLHSALSNIEVNFEGKKVNRRRDSQGEVEITKYYDVYRKGKVRFENVPADSSKNMPNDYMDSIEPYDFSEIKPFSTAYLPGFLAERTDDDWESCYQRIVDRMHQSALSEMEDTARDYTSLEVKDCDIEETQEETKSALFPVYMLYTKWNNQDFLFALNGQTGKMVGDLPVDSTKQAIIFTVSAIVLSVLCCFIVPLIDKELPKWLGILGGVIFAFIIIFCLRAQLKSVFKATNAAQYCTNTDLIDQDDIYVRETTRRISTNNNHNK